MQEEDTIPSKSTPSEVDHEEQQSHRLIYYQSRNQTANDRKRLRRRQRERDEADEELRQQLQQEEMEAERCARDEQIQAQIEASVEERHQALVDESMKQRAIIQELRDQILHKDENFQDSTWEKLEKVCFYRNISEFQLHYTQPNLAYESNSQNLKVDKEQSPALSVRTHEQQEDVTSSALTKSGKMYAAGWHGPRGEKKDLTRYTVKKQGSVSNRRRVLGEYTRASEGFAFVGEQYASRLALLFPQEYYRLCNFAIENHIPSFADLELWANGEPGSTPFANSLTITNRDFANYVHRDRDAIDITYGWWWTAFKPRQRQPWQLNEEHDHGDIKGGEFLIAEYGIAVDFSKTKGLVEIFWRGHKDYHVTMRSTSPQDVTRFGTSVQITQSALRGVQALERHENDPNRVTDHYQRTHDAEEAIKRQQRKQAQKKKKSVV
ncbi:hypothetical protein F5878DRAFT_645427 [Lentinula raphanica]|uniref:Tet-like 2OG-Fe(II) oxygenase domain-containing protein n=1 Tax=Lentinula raphanica TaxID=153919 RepID=A0AA38U9C1_9AGAR|nr:hypothetical protein F5878DRAFT_645427 [Lentinula raphanica]